MSKYLGAKVLVLLTDLIDEIVSTICTHVSRGVSCGYYNGVVEIVKKSDLIGTLSSSRLV